MRRLSILLAPLLLLAGYGVGRFNVTPAPFVNAQALPPRTENSRRIAQPHVAIPRTPEQDFQDRFYEPYLPGSKSAVVAEAKPPAARRPTAIDDSPETFGRSVEPSPATTDVAPGGGTNGTEILYLDFPASESLPKAAPAFIPTAITPCSQQEEQYLNAALKVFRGLGETERQAEFDQMIGRMEEQDAAAELLRLRTELQQLSEKYPKTGAAKQALEAIQTLPIISPPTPGDAAAPAVPASLPASDDAFAPAGEAK